MVRDIRTGGDDGDQARQHLLNLQRRYEGRELSDCALGPRGCVILVITPDKINTPESVPVTPPNPRRRRDVRTR